MRLVCLRFLFQGIHQVDVIATEEDARKLLDQWREGQMKGRRWGTDLTGRHWAIDPQHVIAAVVNPLSDEELVKFGDMLPLAYRPSAKYGTPNPQVWGGSGRN